MEQLNKIQLQRNDLSVYQYNNNQSVNTYIFHSTHATEILLNQYIVGSQLFQLAIESTKTYLQIAHQLLLKGLSNSQICELVCMSGGNFYGTKEAYTQVFNNQLQQAYIGISRHSDGTKNGFDATISYEKFDALPDNATILISDTLATGSTIKKTIMRLMDIAERKGKTIRQIIVYSICGSVKTSQILKQLQDSYQNINQDFKISLFVTECLFGLEENGTDMPFFHQDSVKIPEVESELKKRKDVQERVKCAIFDWGDRCKNLNKHFEELEEYFGHLLKEEKDEEVSQGIRYQIEKIEEEKRKFNAVL